MAKPVTDLFNCKLICDGFMIAAAGKLVFVPLVAIFSGELWGPEAFVGGAVVVGAATFCEFYFAETEEDWL